MSTTTTEIAAREGGEHGLAIHTDRYQLTMLAAYAKAGLSERRAVFELFVRRLPPTRRYLVSCGIGRIAHALAALRFGADDLAWLESDPFLGPAFAHASVRRMFEGFRFHAKVHAIPEGRICFPNQPLVRVEGTLAEAQLVETLLLSVINHDTRIASKCARIARAARDRECFEFGSRRTHEAAAVDAARAAYVAGFAGTSNEEAARRYGIPVTGTMAHAFVLAHAADHGEDGEAAAFRDFSATFPGPSTCLVDTFDTLRGVERAIEGAARSLGGIRIDSGDLATLAIKARNRLDLSSTPGARIVLSNDLDEHTIDALLRAYVPVDAFGVGTMAVSPPDHPSLGAVYKLVAMEDEKGRMVAVQKRSPGKGSSAAPKQVFRATTGPLCDVIAVASEELAGEPLVVPIFDGRHVVADVSAKAGRDRLVADLARADETLLSIEPRTPSEAFPSSYSPLLESIHHRVESEGRVVL
jgi:nicotinate phosphoribosyltransferase